MKFAGYEIGLVMMGAFTAEVAGLITHSSYSWVSAGLYFVIGSTWLGAAFWQEWRNP